MVDRVHEIRPETGRIAADSAERAAAGCERQNRVSDAMEDRLNQTQAQINTLSLDNRRRPRSRWRRRRSRSREREQQFGLCYYYGTFRDRAGKCRASCNWNQGNDSSKSRRIFHY